MRRLLFTLLLLCVAPTAFAQTTTSKISWTQSDVSTVVAAQALVYRLQVDAAPAAVVAQTCVLVGAAVSCSAPIANLPAGSHTLVLTVDNGFGSASASITGTSPASPSSFKITVTVTVP